MTAGAAVAMIVGNWPSPTALRKRVDMHEHQAFTNTAKTAVLSRCWAAPSSPWAR